MHILLLAAQWHHRLISQTENIINTFSRWRLWSVDSFCPYFKTKFATATICMVFFFLLSHPSLQLFVCHLLHSVNVSRPVQVLVLSCSEQWGGEDPGNEVLSLRTLCLFNGYYFIHCLKIIPAHLTLFCRTLSNWLLEFEKWTPSIIVVSYKVT